MPERALTVLVVGASGSIGRHVVTEALAQGHRVRALLRDPAAAGRLPSAVEAVIGDLTEPATLTDAMAGIDAIVFTHGTHGGEQGVRDVDYGGVRNVLTALGRGARIRIALMTAIGVTYRDGSYNRSSHTHDWKRRSERLVRASGHEYTIVRPGWFDYNDEDQLAIELLQGDTRHAGSPADGVISRRQIAQVLVGSLTSPAATGTTFELVAERGPAPSDLEPLFAALDHDAPGSVDAVHDVDNQPLAEEPESVRAELAAVQEAAL